MGRLLDIGEIDYIFPSPTPCKLYGTVRGCPLPLPDRPILPPSGISFQRITVSYSGYCVNTEGQSIRTFDFAGSHLLSRSTNLAFPGSGEFVIEQSPGYVVISDGVSTSGEGTYFDGEESVTVPMVSQLESFPISSIYSSDNLTFLSLPLGLEEIFTLKGLLFGLPESLDLMEGRGAWCFTYQGEIDGVRVDAKYEGAILLSQH